METTTHNRRLDDAPVVNGLGSTGGLIESALRFIRRRDRGLFELRRIEPPAKGKVESAT
ncbi:MAG: hypothetical protein J7551_04075 [Chloroflexi bacterium]|nr:hypothetical protein [Chloroflexota bacterium]